MSINTQYVGPCKVCQVQGCEQYKHSKQYLYKKRKPWVRFVEWARRRCADTDPEGPNYWHYAAKGIKCRITSRDLEEIWERDGAALMKRPSLDRIDPKKDYCRTNVRFVEWYMNIRAPHSREVLDEETPEWVTAP